MSVVKKGEAYYAVIYYRDEFNVARKKWIKAGPSRKEAERLERQFRTDLERGEVSIPQKITVSEYLTRWLEDIIRPNRRPSTYDNYRYAISAVSDMLGDIQLNKLTPINIRKYFDAAQLKVKPTTAHNHYAVLNAALKDAVTEYKLLAMNPCEAVPAPRKNKPKSGAYTVEQVQKILDLMQSTEIYICILLGALCGLRRGEICGLRWRDVDLDARRAYIRHSLDRLPAEYARAMSKNSEHTPLWDCVKKETSATVLALGPTKTEESENSIVLPDFVVREMRELLQEQEWHKNQLGTAYKDLDFVCSWEDGTPFDPDFVYKKFHKVLKQYNAELGKKRRKIEELAAMGTPCDEKVPDDLPLLRIHDLRHTAATMMLQANVDIKIVSRTLRHSRSSFTRDVYQHVLEDMQERPAAVMDTIFKRSDPDAANE
ncbi:tyrosine-type recombinase/integrase [uncultured Cloacibacillus sp.]|uniref:site-specific integrase n=1 Tax=uncultured Cloacibacillus sp. TaxID=889794 RepID=UPI0027D9811D|nr:tyrosine-type recombinase/integrase [uncultured Cloacibacillus sp.]